MKCKLCGSDLINQFYSDPPRTYLHCGSCGLIFTSEDSYLTLKQERARYEMHDNSELNSGYVRFLSAVAETAMFNTPLGGSILDFGCGKNAVLAEILSRKGILCDSYDPLFNYYVDFSNKQYDTIILCEVIEHIRNLHEELSLIQKLLKQDSKVIIRTQQYPSLELFPKWWYRQDSTHLNFFCDKALETFAAKMSRVCVQTPHKDIVVLTPAPVQG